MQKSVAGLVGALFLIVVFGGSCAFLGGAADSGETGGANNQQAAKLGGDKADLYLLAIEAERAVLNGNLEGGIAAYEKIVKIDPSDARAYLNLSQLYIRTGDLNAAMESAKRAYELKPEDDKAAILVAGLYAARGRIDEAVEVYRKLLSDQPDHAAYEEIAILLSNLLIVKKDFDEAGNVLTRLTEKKPDSADAYFALGRIELYEENCEAAVPLLEKAAMLRPDHERAYFSLGYCSEKAEDNEKAIGYYEKSLKINPDNSALRAHLVRMHLSEGNPEEANRQNEMLKYLQISEEDIRLNRGLILYEQARFAEAIAEFDLILSSAPKSGGALYYKALCLSRLSRLDEALEVYGKIPEDHKLYVDSLIAQGSIMRRMGKPDQAEQILSKARELAPDDPYLIRSLALVYSDLGRRDDALNMLEKAVELTPDDHHMVYSLANIHERNGDWKKAISLMEGVLKKDPENTDALNFIGYTLLEHNSELKRAERLLEKASGLLPNDGFIMDSYGWLLYKRKKYSEALPVLIKSLSLAPDEAVIAEHVGDCYLALGDKENALAYYKKALTLFPEPKVMKEIMDKVKKLEK